MIGYLKGILVDIEDNVCILDVQGVGYNVYCSNRTVGELKSLNLDDAPIVKLFTKLIHREDAMDLYGFLSKDDIRLFDMLLTVNGIGPKKGLQIIGASATGQIIQAIVSENDQFLMKLSGIGKRKSQQIILELKEKLKKRFNVVEKVVAAEYYDAVIALESLGFSKTESIKAVDRVVKDGQNGKDLSKIVEDALKILS